MRGYPYFSLWIPNSPCKDLLFPHGPNLAQKPLYLVGTVLKVMCLSSTKDKKIECAFEIL